MATPRVLLAIPVYNGEEVVTRCLRSAARLTSTTTEFETLVLDDASPLEGFSERIRELCRELGIGYYRSPRNLGIPRNFNLALGRALDAGFDYVVLVNSDVVPSAEITDRIVAPFLDDTTLASVTAWSNNVSIFSLPHNEDTVSLADPALLEWTARTLATEFGAQTLEIPVAVGSCLAIPTPVVREVGLMDPIFGRGYCEEVDWSCRATALGYRAVLAPGALVFHEGGVSSREAGLLPEGQTTLPANEAIIDLRYPDYRERVGAFMAGHELTALRERGLRQICRESASAFGYHLELGVTGAPNSVRNLQVHFTRSAGGAQAVANYQGFTAVIGSGPDYSVEDLVESLGVPPRSGRFFAHGGLSEDDRSAAAALGIRVTEVLAYPARI